MALRLLSVPLPSSSPLSSSKLSTCFLINPISKSSWRATSLFQWQPKRRAVTALKASQVKLEERSESESSDIPWRKVSAVLFDMDGVLCNSEELSRRAAVDVFAEMGVDVSEEDFVPFMGTGEANFLGGVATLRRVEGFNAEEAKRRFFEIYLDKYAKPDSGIGFPGAFELITLCKSKGLKVAVASSADRVKVDANLAAAGLPLPMFDAIVSADAFENLKPAPDIFLSASEILSVPPDECIVIEDALAGVQAANAAQMRCIAVKTTLSEEVLNDACPSLIRKDIGNISIDDILFGGASSPNLKTQEKDLVSQPNSIAKHYNSFSQKRLQGTRRDVLRFGSLAVALSCLYFTIANWKAMQYASPKALWNLLFGTQSPSFKQSKGYARVQQFVDYIAYLEEKGTAPSVPEFPSKLDWLNSAPLQFRRDLRGKVIVLDFWTYCCINCMHVLPDLEFLEKKYKDEPFTVIGVHSAKFDNEKDLEAIRSAVLRYEIIHPVVNDGEMNLWRELGVNSWPTFAVVAPNGKLIAQVSGEGHRKDLDDLVEAALIYYSGKKILDSKPIPLKLEKDNDPRLLLSPLKFPGKLAVDVTNSRLFISDSNHNRIVVTDLDGNFIVQIGSSGEEGLVDGSFDDTTFNRPQGLAYNPKKDILYVADTENHALREVDFVNETVRTLAGNGTKGYDYVGGRTGSSQLLNSPWDVCYDPLNEKVYIAMAGQHQIWEYDPDNKITRAFSGDGYERNLNGSSFKNTSFAQPSGISLNPDMMEIYIADSESSSIRALNLRSGGSRLLVGGDPFFPENLFKFGDRDGVGSEVLLQHPMGIFCARDGQIYIADSYNHKIKKVDVDSKRVTTIAGIGKAGFKDGKNLVAQLSEPAGIVQLENGRLYIADTNNSVIRYIDPDRDAPELRTLELKGVQPPTPRSRPLKRLRKRVPADTRTITVDGGSAKEGILRIQISLPEGYHFSKEAQSKFISDIESEDLVSVNPSKGYLNVEGAADLHFKRASPSACTGRISCKVYYCKEDKVCLYESLVFELLFQEETPDGNLSEIRLEHTVKPRISMNSLQLPANF